MSRILFNALTMLLFGLGTPMSAQAPASPAAKPGFDVASIRRNVSADQGGSVRPQGDGLAITNNTLFNIIRNAYNVQSFQIVGGPDWISRDRWDILAKAEGVTQPQQMMVLLQSLIAERFKADVRKETRDMQVYALTLARGDGRLGPGLRPASFDCEAFRAGARPGGPPPPPRANGLPSCGMNMNLGRANAGGYLIADIARNLSNATGRIIIDRTRLTGRYDMELEWAPDALQAPTPGAGDASSLFTAVQEQLGLKLEAQRAPVDVLVVHSAERPVED